MQVFQGDKFSRTILFEHLSPYQGQNPVNPLNLWPKVCKSALKLLLWTSCAAFWSKAISEEIHSSWENHTIFCVLHI